MRTAALFLLLASAAPGFAAARPPVVVELYTAQGCASCGEANAFVSSLAARKGVLPLTFAVDYWDYLGWRDTFAKPEFAERQQAYVNHLSLREPYTPQVVVDGRAQAAGVKTDRVETLVKEAVKAPGRQTEKIERLVNESARAPRDPPDMQFVGGRRVDVGSGRVPRGGAEVWLIRFDPREQEVTVKSGDNRGQTIVHRNVVREIKRLGAWKGRPTAYRLPQAAEDGLQTVVIVQGTRGGRVVGVARSKS